MPAAEAQDDAKLEAAKRYVSLRAGVLKYAEVPTANPLDPKNRPLISSFAAGVLRQRNVVIYCFIN